MASAPSLRRLAALMVTLATRSAWLARTGVAALLASALVLSACGATAPPTREPDQYDGCASDELWPIFDAAERATTVDDARAPAFTAPATGATLDGAAPARFAFDATPTIAGDPLGDATCIQCSVCGGVHAQHLAPVTGTAYDLVFTASGAPVYRVLTTLQAVTPSDAAWSAMRGQSVSLRATRLPVDENQPPQGAFVASAPFTFTVSD